MGFTVFKIKLPARTLTSILDEANVRKTDLQGLNFDKYRPEFILVECLNEQSFQQIEAYIADYYDLFEKASQVDYLFKSKE